MIEDMASALFNAISTHEAIDTDDGLQAALLANADKIRALAEACEQTAMFQKAREQFAEFADDHDSEWPADQRLMQAWIHLLVTLRDAPTKLHTMGTIRMCIPLVARYLPPADA